MADAPLVTVAVFNERQKWALSDAHLARLREAASSAEVVAVTSGEALNEVLPEIRWLIGCPLTAEQLLSQGKKLEWVQCTTSADENILASSPLVASDVRLSAASRIRAPQVTEHAVMLTLALLRRLPICVQAKLEQRWLGGETADKVRNLEDATVSLIADRGSRSVLSERYRAFGCEVLALDIFGDGDRGFAHELLGADRVDDLLGRCDVLVLALPPFPTLRHYISPARLGQLPRHATLINVGAPTVLDETALLDALDLGELAAAAVDCLTISPPPAASPVWTNPRLLMTPGLASVSRTYWDRAVTVIGANMQRLQAGEPLLDEVPAVIRGTSDGGRQTVRT